MNPKWPIAANSVIKRIRKQLDTSRWWSAAWKASAKKYRAYWRLRAEECFAAEKRGDNYRDTGNSALIREAEERARADKAEKRVAELEEVVLLALEELERPYDELKKYEGIRGRNDARYILRAALNK